VVSFSRFSGSSSEIRMRFSIVWRFFNVSKDQAGFSHKHNMELFMAVQWFTDCHVAKYQSNITTRQIVEQLALSRKDVMKGIHYLVANVNCIVMLVG
jgi:hypothetical protein